jgi:hypothetical protein
LTELNIPFQFAETADEAALADTLDFPLIRPSYVLGGQGMKIVINKQELGGTHNGIETLGGLTLFCRLGAMYMVEWGWSNAPFSLQVVVCNK